MQRVCIFFRHVRTSPPFALVRFLQDFLLLSFVCFTYGVALPFIAADEAFGSIAVVHRMLRRAGAFFVSRGGPKGRGNRNERALMQKVNAMLMKLFVQCVAKRYGIFEVFLEGGRSKTGAFCVIGFVFSCR